MNDDWLYIRADLDITNGLHEKKHCCSTVWSAHAQRGSSDTMSMDHRVSAGRPSSSQPGSMRKTTATSQHLRPTVSIKLRTAFCRCIDNDPGGTSASHIACPWLSCPLAPLGSRFETSQCLFVVGGGHSTLWVGLDQNSSIENTLISGSKKIRQSNLHPCCTRPNLWNGYRPVLRGQGMSAISWVRVS